jgi:topoisomerase-4 subunit B
MKKDSTYTGKDIRVMSDREHVRERTSIYLGSTNPAQYRIPLLSAKKFTIVDVEFIPAVYKAVGEIIDNSIDEFAHTTSKVKLLKFDAKPDIGKYSVSDNGRGVPIDKHVSGKHTPEVVFGSMKSGRNFTDDKQVGVIGQNGVGSSCVNICSTDFEVTVTRDNQKYYQKFTDGADRVSRPKITATTDKKTGTQIDFQLDPEVFNDISLPDDLILNRAMEIAMTNPDITVEYNGTRFRYRDGFKTYIDAIAAGDNVTTHQFDIETENTQGQFYVIHGATGALQEEMFTWVNSSLLFDGGKINTQFFNALFTRMTDDLQSEAKKRKCQITRNDVCRNMLVLANVKVKNPEYDSQAKTRLTGPDLRRELNDGLEQQWVLFRKKFKTVYEEIIEHADDRYHQHENKKAIADAEKNRGKKLFLDGLLDATGNVRSSCMILITEGESAKSQISEARDSKTTAAFALTGKINNVYGNTPAQVLKMGKITDMLTAIGLIPGKKAIRSDLRYGRIVIATDADNDGDDIFTLLCNLFYQFWPELMDSKYEPFVYRLVAPNICLIKGSKRIHFSNRAEYEANRNKYSGYEVRYFKGLGSMNLEDWEMILSGETDTMLPIIDDGNLKETFSLLFSADSEPRKRWLESPVNSKIA